MYLSDNSKARELEIDIFSQTALVRFTINRQLNTLWLFSRQKLYNN